MRTEVRPPWPFRLPAHGGMDGVLRHRGGVLERLLHHGEQPVVVRVAQPSVDRVAFDASAPTGEAAEHGIARMRFALGVDEDLRAFHARFARDPLIGESVRRRPWLRVRRRPEPWEALAWAVCEQLIEFERAAAIERRIVHGGWGAAVATCATCRPRLRLQPSLRRCCNRSTWAARGRARWCAWRGRWRVGGSTFTPPITSAPGDGCARSRASARGR